jgi:hypothetical protein
MFLVCFPELLDMLEEDAGPKTVFGLLRAAPVWRLLPYVVIRFFVLSSWSIRAENGEAPKRPEAGDLMELEEVEDLSSSLGPHEPYWK